MQLKEITSTDITIVLIHPGNQMIRKASDISHSSDNHKFNKTYLEGNSKINNKNARKQKKKIFLGILIFLLCVILGIVVTFSVMRYLGQKKLLNYDNVNMISLKNMITKIMDVLFITMVVHMNLMIIFQVSCLWVSTNVNS